MSKKQDTFYFEHFVDCGRLALGAAQFLESILTDFDPKKLEKWQDAMHQIEHDADGKKHEITDRLAKAFITPLEREDIVELSYHIDEMTDKLEEVLIRIYINNVQEIRPEALQMLRSVVKCLEEVCALLEELSDFRHSKKMKERIIRINSMEEEVDRLFISAMRKLHTEEKEALQVLAWREIYEYLEKCADSCEHVADSVEGIVMKNS
ncbi:MAG TPA: DUF47 domain-containing protein [Candidatus Limivivens merdigallinarum]|uniref:DUF47 domain-containing protein n=1 Tax=Candidatus Limivivens merdigallinarum TaxID=2840859 RepID=A0A9D0ZXD4_9FIRM|nr:DUF47 domain-containing protein [Candidatus Limivivens merdigallinarum]